MREKRWFPIGYMFLVTAFFSSIVIGLTRFTSERVEANERLAFEKAVLSVLPGLYDFELSRLELHRKFTEKLSKPDPSSAGAYTLRRNGSVVAYALPISGQGFWAPIKGVIGIKADQRTITGIAIYEQNETPGLGAEITKTEFRSQFEGKVISTDEQPIDIKRPGTELDKSEVHGIAGATQTSTRLEKIINTALSKWRTQMTEENEEK